MPVAVKQSNTQVFILFNGVHNLFDLSSAGFMVLSDNINIKILTIIENVPVPLFFFTT